MNDASYIVLEGTQLKQYSTDGRSVVREVQIPIAALLKQPKEMNIRDALKAVFTDLDRGMEAPESERFNVSMSNDLYGTVIQPLKARMRVAKFLSDEIDYLPNEADGIREALERREAQKRDHKFNWDVVRNLESSGFFDFE